MKNCLILLLCMLCVSSVSADDISRSPSSSSTDTLDDVSERGGTTDVEVVFDGGDGSLAGNGYSAAFGNSDSGFITFGDNDGQIGVSADGTVAGFDLDGIFLMRLVTDPGGPIMYAVINPDNTIRFALARNGTGYVTANPRSLAVGTGIQWGTNTVWGPYLLTNAGFNAGTMDFDPGATGGDLLVEDDVGVGGDLFVLGTMTGNGSGITNTPVAWADVPATAGAAGTAGDVAYDSSFLYVCTATNTWKRVPIATW